MSALVTAERTDLIPRHCDDILEKILTHITSTAPLDSADRKSSSSSGSHQQVDPSPQRRGGVKSHLISITGEDCSGKTSFLKSLSCHPRIQSKFPANRRLWYNLGDAVTPEKRSLPDLTQRNDILRILDWIGCQVSQEFNYNENFYRPDSVEEWIFYLKDLCHLQEWILFLDNVSPLCNHSLLHILHETGVNIIFTSLPFSSVSFPHVTIFHLNDFTSEELSCYVETYRQVHQTPFPLTSTFTRLLHDLSTSPLDIRILLSLISNYYHKRNSEATVTTEEFNGFLSQLYDKRTDIAALSQEELVKQSHPLKFIAPSTSRNPQELHHLRLLMTEVNAESQATDLCFSESHMRRTSILMNSQIALSSLPDHVQAKFILLCVLPKYQATSLAFLSHLWQCSLPVAYETILSLFSVDLLQFSPNLTSGDIPHEMAITERLLVSLHSIHYEYLDSLIHSSTIWVTRVQLAVTRAKEYLIHPRCIITTDKYSTLDWEAYSRLPLDEFFFPLPQMSAEFARLGLYWRRVSLPFGLIHLISFFVCSSWNCIPSLIQTYSLCRNLHSLCFLGVSFSL